MDFSILAGVGCAIACIMVSLLIDQAQLTAYISVSAGIIVIGGTIGTTLATVGLSTFFGLPKLAVVGIFGKADFGCRGLIDQISSFSYLVRKEGMLALEPKLEEQSDPFFKKALQLAVDGLEGSVIAQILDEEIEGMERRHKRNYGIFTTMGGYAPSMGIVGTVLGLISMLMGLGGAGGMGSLGKAVAVAFLTTLYGVMLANLVFLPIASNLKAKSEDEAVYRRVVVEGVLSLQTGENPRLLKEKLLAVGGVTKNPVQEKEPEVA